WRFWRRPEAAAAASERDPVAPAASSGVAIFDLDYDAILSAMYPLSASAEGDCYRCVPFDPGIEAAALGASESSLPGTAPAEALHTFTLDSDASHCFFRDSTTLTPLPAPVPVRLADPSGGQVIACSSTVLPCPAVPCGSPSGLHLPSFSMNLDTLRTTLAALGFAPSTADPSLYLRIEPTMPPFYILVYADDLFFATADTEALTLVKEELQKRHTCTELGELRSYLGLQISRDRARRTITLTRSHMVHQVVQRFDFEFSSPQSTPLPTGHSLSAPPLDESVEPRGQHPKLMGCLMYLMTCSRPDLAYPLSILARYVAPGRHQPEHWRAAKRALRYFCSTSGMGLVLGGRGSVLQQRGQLRPGYVASQANSANVFTKALGFGDHQRLCTALGLVPTLPHLLVA
ncbi:unnamed protein product, partial [Closterium sp. NIES-53]